MSESNSPTLEARRAQMFPVLAADEIARLHRPQAGVPLTLWNGGPLLPVRFTLS
jgi:hypothetical protein